MAVNYGNPPLSECVCEFKFEPINEWDIVYPGLIFNEVQNTFPKRKQTGRYDIQFVKDAKNPLTISPKPTELVQFLTKEENVLMVVGENYLSVNHFKKDYSWDNFFKYIMLGFTAYSKITTPKSFKRIGMLYSNIINIQSAVPIKLQDYFKLFPEYPYVENNMPVMNKFQLSVELPFESSRDLAKISLNNVPTTKPDLITLIFNMDYFLNIPGNVKIDDVFNWVDNAHNHLERIFEITMNEKLKNQWMSL